MDSALQQDLELVDAADESVVAVARHRRHRFPARTESLRARYDRDELAVVAAAAARAGMTASGYVAATALAVASTADRRTRRGTGSCWPSCCRRGWRSAGMR
jgi:hypothetical protein